MGRRTYEMGRCRRTTIRTKVISIAVTSLVLSKMLSAGEAGYSKRNNNRCDWNGTFAEPCIERQMHGRKGRDLI